MKLTDDERRMLDGGDGPAVAAAMDLLVRYGDVLGAERLTDTDNVCGANIFNARQRELGGATPDDVFAQISLDSPGGFEIPAMRAHSCQLIGPMDTIEWRTQGVLEPARDAIIDSESYSGRHGIHLMNTCTPYQVGNVPARGEHCAWMESSAVIYVNSVLGAMTNVEGRESAAAAMLTGKIPYWGYHLPENRHATIHVEVTVDVTSNRDWGLLGYAVGAIAGEAVPVITGIAEKPNLVKLKHFGAAAATSGGVELYHIPGVTAEAQTLGQALGDREPALSVRYGRAERAAAYARLHTTAADTAVDLVMIGCPHASLDQIRDVCDLLGDRKVAPGTALWVFTPRGIRLLAERSGYGDRLRAAGGVLMSDTCPAIGRFVPDGTRVIVTDSAKQAHYLPAIMDVQGWFGTTGECVDAAVTGRWEGEQP
ncbi:MAG TPA: aconitase X catalytic domain-containing protein [Trebonia sp.]